MSHRGSYGIAEGFLGLGIPMRTRMRLFHFGIAAQCRPDASPGVSLRLPSCQPEVILPAQVRPSTRPSVAFGQALGAFATGSRIDSPGAVFEIVRKTYRLLWTPVWTPAKNGGGEVPEEACKAASPGRRLRLAAPAVEGNSRRSWPRSPNEAGMAFLRAFLKGIQEQSQEPALTGFFAKWQKGRLLPQPPCSDR